MTRVHDVTAAILERSPRPTDPMSLQKFLFYAQGWMLMWREKPLFPETIQAWREGPVVPEVYATYSELKSAPIPHPYGGAADQLTNEEARLVDIVLAAYSPLDGRGLSGLTHENPAWQVAWESRPNQAERWGREPIDIDVLRDSMRTVENQTVPGRDVRRKLTLWRMESDRQHQELLRLAREAPSVTDPDDPALVTVEDFIRESVDSRR